MYLQPIKPDELYHFGILGMKWGIRKNKRSYSVTRKKKKNRVNAVPSKAIKIF